MPILCEEYYFQATWLLHGEYIVCLKDWSSLNIFDTNKIFFETNHPFDML